MTTYGETLVHSLLSSLPRGKFFVYAEPRITGVQSARQNPDFVIVSAALGVIVIEVKDWVKIRKATQREVEIERRDGTLMTVENPVETARGYATNLARKFEQRDELLRNLRGRQVLKFPWLYAVALPNIDRAVVKQCEDKGIWERGQVLSRQELTSDKIESALRIIPSVWRLETPLSTEVVDVLRGVLDPTVIITDAVGSDVGTVTLKQEAIIREPLKVEKKPVQQALLSDDFMTDETVEVAETVSVRLVRGVAGSGKSLVLARRAQFLAEQNPDFKVLVLAFNTDLVADLKRRIQGVANLEIINFHKLCSNILSGSWRSPLNTGDWLSQHAAEVTEQNGLDLDFLAEEIEWRKELGIYDDAEYLTMSRQGRGKALNREKRLAINTIFNQYLTHQKAYDTIDWGDVPRRVLARLSLGHPMKHAFDIVLIDEAQDFAPSWIQVVKQLLKPTGHAFLADDPTQSLFRSFSWRQKGLEVVGRTRILRIPFRCTREITAAAYSLIGADANLSSSEEITQPDLTTYELASGDKPFLVASKEMLHEIKLVEQQARSLAKLGIPPSSIAILCHNKRIVKHWAFLRQHGFYVETFNKMKGLEFRAALIPYLNTAFEKHDADEDDNTLSDLRRRVFTAMTRAREILILSYHGQMPSQLAPLEPHVQRQLPVELHGTPIL